ncbi:MAG TPA: S8 family serine peptidase [Longimicrobiales bacterium]|nr:S8 family serine peptidase [Longimicrobiales bacterium]
MTLTPAVPSLPTARLLVLLLLALFASACQDHRLLRPADPQANVAPGVARCELNFSDDEVRAELAGLLASVVSLESAGVLNAGQARALRNHLANAGARLAPADYCAVRAQLAAFREQLENLAADGVLAEDQVRPLIRVVNRLLNDRPPELSVDPTLMPVAPTVAGIRGGPARPLARFVSTTGRVVDFVANELYLMTDDAGARDAFLGRWGGTILLTLDFHSIGATTPPVYLVQIDPSGADVDGLAERWAASAGLNGENYVSSTAGLQLLAAAVEEAADRGLKVGMNFMLESAAYSDRSTTDGLSATMTAPDGSPYSPNAFTWPYMNRGSPQNIGTAEAWRVMDAMGRFANRVRIGVADGGFRPNDDFPDVWSIAGALRTPNPDPGNCGSDGPPTLGCVWHGTNVVMAGMAQADNGFGAAGPAGPVAEAVLLQSPSMDFIAFMEYILDHIPTALGSGNRIINISASSALPSEWCLLAVVGLPLCETLHGITSAFRAAGILVVAAAGNNGHDVDMTRVFGVWPFEFTEESDLIIPCELTTVLCVGGLGWNGTGKHGSSNWGSDRTSLNTVRMFGPFDVWSVADAVAADEMNTTPNGDAGIISGTSYAAPYVAGVAGLVWAANPGLHATQVEQLLLSNAHTHSTDPRVPRWVNALGAVRQAVGGNTPPFVSIISPLDGSRHPRGRVMIEFAADVEDLDGDAVNVTWRSDRDGVIGTGHTLRRNDLSFGTHVVTATASDGVFSTESGSVAFEVFNEFPTLELITPRPWQYFCVGQTVSFLANATDLNNPPAFDVPEANITWHLGSRSGPVFGTGSSASHTFDVAGEHQFHVSAQDIGGLYASETAMIRMRDCDGLVPTATILEPAADTPYGDSDWTFDGFDASRGEWYKDVTLRGEGMDPEDGVLTGAALTWSLRLDNGSWSTLGTGADLNVRLYSAECTGRWHTVRLLAADSDGNTSAAALRRIHIWTLC